MNEATMHSMLRRIAVAILVISACGAAGRPAGAIESRRGNITASGAFTCDFGLPPDIDFATVPGALERDRMYQSAQDEFVRKIVPLAITETGEVFAGGRYLFEGRDGADAYKVWLETEFVLDGTLFFDRPVFLAPRCLAWSVIGAHDFAPLDAHVVVRTEWWSVPADNQRKALLDGWSELFETASGRGLAGFWVLYNKHDNVVAFVYFGRRVAPPDPSMPDFASLAAVALAPPLGDVFAAHLWVKVFDRSHWALATWRPFAPGDSGEPSLWPNSPPFPLPYPGDGVCEPSRGESSITAPMDCAVTCGDGVAQPDETNVSCPGDVPYS